MKTSTKVIIAGVSIVVVVLLLLIMSYSTWVYEQGVQQEENINEQVENLQVKYRQDFREEIQQYPSYRVISEVLGESSVKEMYRDYLEALNSGSERDADNMYERF